MRHAHAATHPLRETFAHLCACHVPDSTSVPSSHSCRPSAATTAEAAQALPPLPLSPEGWLPPATMIPSLQPPPPPRALHGPRQKKSVWPLGGRGSLEGGNGELQVRTDGEARWVRRARSRRYSRVGDLRKCCVSRASTPQQPKVLLQSLWYPPL